MYTTKFKDQFFKMVCKSEKPFSLMNEATADIIVHMSQVHNIIGIKKLIIKRVDKDPTTYELTAYRAHDDIYRELITLASPGDCKGFYICWPHPNPECWEYDKFLKFVTLRERTICVAVDIDVVDAEIVYPNGELIE